jgi:hypothetical protein
MKIEYRLVKNGLREYVIQSTRGLSKRARKLWRTEIIVSTLMDAKKILAEFRRKKFNRHDAEVFESLRNLVVEIIDE